MVTFSFDITVADSRIYILLLFMFSKLPLLRLCTGNLHSLKYFLCMCRMQRNRGQFTSSKPKGDEATSELTASDGSPNWGSVEGRPPSAAE